MDVADFFNSETAQFLVPMSAFSVIGGVLLGISLRAVLDDFRLQNVLGRAGLLIWGGVASCITLVIAVQGGLLMVGGQVAILLVAFAIPFFWRDRLREMTSNTQLVLIVLGSLSLAVGLALAGINLGKGQFLPGVPLGIFFSLAGGGVLAIGLRNLFQEGPRSK